MKLKPRIIVPAIMVAAMICFFVVPPVIYRAELPDILSAVSITLATALSLVGSYVAYRYM